MKINASIEHYASVSRDLDADTAASNRAARAELPCSECGSDFGMCGGWTRDALASTVVPATGLVLFHGEDDHQLFYPCWQCNQHHRIPDDFTPLTPEQVAAWLGRACTCPDCEREGKDHD